MMKDRFRVIFKGDVNAIFDDSNCWPNSNYVAYFTYELDAKIFVDILNKLHKKEPDKPFTYYLKKIMNDTHKIIHHKHDLSKHDKDHKDT